MNQQIATSLTPQQRALILGVAMPDVPGKPLPPIRLLQSNSPDLVEDNEMFLAGAVKGGFVVPNREGRVFQPSPPGIRFGIFGWSTTWHIYEKRPDGSNKRIDSLPQKPSDAVWREDAEGRRACVDGQGHAVVETLSCFMRLVGGQVGRFDFSKTALRPGNELATRSQRLSIKDGDLKGSILGLFQMTSRLETQGPQRRWYLPVPIQLGKLGEKHGPSLDDVLALAKLRQAFLEGAPLPESPEPPAIAAPTRPRPIITSGRAALANSEPPSAPPPAEYDGPDDAIDEVINF
jgi:hypothetical protein